MSWAEVKTINSDPSVPLNNLIGTNMRILENTDDRLSDYTSYSYMLYNKTLDYITSNGVSKLKNKFSRKVYNNSYTIPRYNGIAMTIQFCIPLKNKLYFVCYPSSNVTTSKTATSVYDVDKGIHIPLCELENTSSTLYNYSNYTGVIMFRISENRYLIISSLKLCTANSESSSTTTYKKIGLSELIIEDNEELTINTIDVDNYSYKGVKSEPFNYSHSACFLSGSHTEIVFNNSGKDVPSSNNNAPFYNEHILVDISDFKLINNEYREPIYTSTVVLNYYYSHKVPIYYEDNTYLKLSALYPNQGMTNSSYGYKYISFGQNDNNIWYWNIDMYYKNPTYKSGSNEFMGIFASKNIVNSSIRNNVLYTVVTDYNGEKPSIMTTAQKSLASFKSNVYVRCIESSYNSSTKKVVCNIKNRLVGTNKIYSGYSYYSSSYFRYHVQMDDFFARFVGDDILIVTPLLYGYNYGYSNMSSSTGYELKTYNNQFVSYRIRNFELDDYIVEDIDFGFNQLTSSNLKYLYGSTINNIFFGTSNVSDSYISSDYYLLNNPFIIDNFYAFNEMSGSASAGKYPIGFSFLTIDKKPTSSNEFIQIIKDICNCINYIKIPVMKGMKIMIEVKDCIIEGDVTIIDSYNVKCNSDGIVYIYHSKDVPYMIAPSN